MTQEEVLSKADELGSKYGCKVTPLLFKNLDGEGDIVGYLKEISRMAKLRVMDSMVTGGYSACSQLLDDCLLPESDPKIMADDRYYIGAVQEIQNMVTLAVNQFKKK